MAVRRMRPKKRIRQRLKRSRKHADESAAEDDIDLAIETAEATGGPSGEK